MKLTDLDTNNAAVRALNENFAFKFDISGLNRPQTLNMLKKVSGLIKESRRSPGFHKSETSSTYMKMLFMEQALSDHLLTAKAHRIVLENEEVEKSQVILAAQDMIDSVQKWYEEVNDMLVKELPALTDSIESEIGVNESTSFNEAVSTALTSLNSTLQETQTALKSALGTLTGQEATDAFASPEGEDDGMGDFSDTGAEGDEDLGDLGDMGSEEEPGPELPPLPDMGDEEELGGNIGRAKR